MIKNSSQLASFLAVGLAMLSSITAMAEAPDIQGDVDIVVVANEVVNVAVGANSSAQVVAGSIMQGDVVGDVSTNVTVQTISNAAQAAGSCSQVILGSIGVANCMGQ